MPKSPGPHKYSQCEAANFSECGHAASQTIENHEQSHLKAASRTNQKRLNLGLKTKESPSIKTSESGKHFKPSLKLIRMRHAQPQTTANTDNLIPVKIMNKTASKQPQTPQSVSKSSATTQNMLNHSLLDSQSINSRPPNHSQPTKKPRLQPTSQPHPTNQPSSQPIDRPTNGPASQPASQSAQPANQPTNQPTSQPVRPTGACAPSQHPETSDLPPSKT